MDPEQQEIVQVNCSVHFELSKTWTNNTDRQTDRPVNRAPDLTGRVTSSYNHYT